MIGEAPVTVTVSCRAATANSTFTLAVNPSVTWMPSRRSVLNPTSSNCTV